MADSAALTREKLLAGLRAYLVFKADPAGCSEDEFDQWSDFAHTYGAELCSLALVALDRLEPKLRGPRPRHQFGPAQQKALDTLKDGPKTCPQICVATGLHERNLRRNLVTLTARGVLVSAKDPFSEATLWGLPGCTFPTLPPELPLSPPRARVEEAEVIPPPPPQTPAKPARAAVTEKPVSSQEIDPKTAANRALPVAPAPPADLSPSCSPAPARGPGRPRSRKPKPVEEPTRPTTAAPPPDWMLHPTKPPSRKVTHV